MTAVVNRIVDNCCYAKNKVVEGTSGLIHRINSIFDIIRTENPVTKVREFHLIDHDIEWFLDKVTTYFVFQTSERVADKAIETRVRNVAKRLSIHIDDPKGERKWKVYVINNYISNAFCLPNGTIFVTKEILEKIDKMKTKLPFDSAVSPDDRLAALLGHEMTHACARHASKKINLIAALILGSSALSAILHIPGLITAVNLCIPSILAAHSRPQETQCDIVGMKYAKLAGYDPRGMICLHQTLAKSKNRHKSDLFTLYERVTSSHPPLCDRVKKCTDVYNKFFITGDSWRHLKGFE